MKIRTCLAFMFLSFFATSVAMAQDPSLVELAGPVLQAITSGNYAYASALALVLLVALIRAYGGVVWEPLASKTLAPVLVLVASFGAAMSVTLSAGQAVTLVMCWTALKIAVIAAGGYSLLKPLVKYLQGKAPIWMLPIFMVLSSVFDTKKKAAEKAGRVAVSENPSEGTEIDFRDVK